MKLLGVANWDEVELSYRNMTEFEIEGRLNGWFAGKPFWAGDTHKKLAESIYSNLQWSG